MPKVLITGAYGLIGNVVYRHLCESSRYEVYGLSRRRLPSDRLPSSQLAPIPDDHFFLVDLTDEAALQRAVQGMDAILHQAALGSVPRSIEDPLAFNAANVTGTLALLEEARLAALEKEAAARRRLDSPDTVPALVEELLRWDSPALNASLRFATEDLVIAGTTVERGASVTLSTGAATRDPDRFAEEKERGLTIDLGFASTTLPSVRATPRDSAERRR